MIAKNGPFRRVRIQADQRREEFFDVATRIFKEKGYRAATVQDIVDEMGITKGAFYHYFASKEDLLTEIYDRAGTQFYDMMMRITQENLSVAEKLRALVVAHVKLMVDERMVFTVFFKEKLELPEERQRQIKEKEEAYFRLVKDLAQQAVNEGLLASVDPRLIALNIIGACNWVTQWYDPEGPLSPDEIGGRFFEIITCRTGGSVESRRKGMPDHR
ncbi:MAG: TetR/AcrR family transcriptional regulator [Chloroflexota bacterium]|nr:MAG: TetR/AcrR family transcriptional regulator [Chloroflexota bacterium]